MQRRKHGGEDSGYRVSNDDAEGNHPSKGESPLSDRDCDQAGLAETVLHSGLERIGSTQFGVLDNQANRPIDSDGQHEQEDNAGQEACLFECVWLSNDSRADDAVGHVHKSTAETTLGPGRFEQVFLEILDVVGDGHTGRLNARQERRSLLSARRSVTIHIVLFLDPVVVRLSNGVWFADLEAHSMRRPGLAIGSALRKTRLSYRTGL